jgi:hypothetical protein
MSRPPKSSVAPARSAVLIAPSLGLTGHRFGARIGGGIKLGLAPERAILVAGSRATVGALSS